MTSLSNIKNKLKILKPILQAKYPLEAIAVFGSYARNEQNEQSDIDIMVALNDKIGIEFIAMANEIEDYLGIETDVISRKGIKPRYFEFIKQDLIYV